MVKSLLLALKTYFLSIKYKGWMGGITNLGLCPNKKKYAPPPPNIMIVLIVVMIQSVVLRA